MEFTFIDALAIVLLGISLLKLGGTLRISTGAKAQAAKRQFFLGLALLFLYLAGRVVQVCCLS
jgi:hypothetical protein